MKGMDLKNTLIAMTLLTILGKILGIARESVLASLWGASYIADAYLTAGTVGGIVFGWLLSVYICYTPVYVEVCSTKSTEEGKQFTGNLLVLMVAVYTVLAAILFVGRDLLISVIVPGYSDEAKAMTSYFLAIAAPSIIVIPIVNLLKAYLDANGHFVSSLTSDSMTGFVQIGMILLGGLFGIKYLAYALLIPFIIQVLVVGTIIKFFKLDFPLRPGCTSDVGKIVHLLFPVCVSSILTEINSFIDKLFASLLEEGSVSILNYSLSVREAVLNVFMYAFITISFPLLSKYVAEQDGDRLRDFVQKSLQNISAVFIPLTVGTMILSENIIRIIYENGNFGQSAVLSAQQTLMIYLLAIFPIVLRTYLFKVFYAFQDTRISVRVGLLSTCSNVFFNFVLVKPFGRCGLVLATTISDFIIVPVLLYSLKKRVEGIEYGKMGITCLKSILSSAAMGFIMLIVYNALPDGGKLLLVRNSFLCFVAGVLSFYGTARILKMEQTIGIGHWIQKAAGRRRSAGGMKQSEEEKK